MASAAAVALGLSVIHDVQATAVVEKPSWVKPATVAYRREECIYRAIRRDLPQGAAVYLTVSAASWRGAPKLAKELSPVSPWVVTRLAELSTLWAVPQPTPATARWTLSLVPEPGHCSGLALEVRRR